jgi:hypothetical protein
MVQAVTDDENPETRRLWAYPDTGEWDPERNTDEFCAMLPEYRRHGLLGITVGLQAGGSVYRPEVWQTCETSAFRADGTLKEPWTDRLLRILKTADDCGMIVIVNFFYWKQIRLIPEDRNVIRAVETAADFLLRSGYRNILVDVANECAEWWNRPVCEPANIPKLIRTCRSVTLGGRRLLTGSSTGGDNLETAEWLETEDFSLPHGNGNTPALLRERLNIIRQSDAFRKRPRPLLINEDSERLDNMRVSVEEYASWGYYAQGAGSGGEGYDKIWGAAREKDFPSLSGFQTLPVNWSINDKWKKAYFDLTRKMTGG